MITPLELYNNLQEYKEDPTFCPICRSEKISGSQLDESDMYIYRDNSCHDCTAMWSDEFVLHNVVLHDEEEHITDEEENAVKQSISAVDSGS